MAKMPIRNKSKDNPYTLGYDEDKQVYTVEFVDNMKVIHKVEISEKVYKAFDSFELEDISQIHKYRKHIEHNEIYEETLEHRMLEKPITIEEEVEEKIMLDDIKTIIDSLPDIQKRRLKKYYFEDKTFEEIALEEGCSKVAVKYSIDIALEKISQNFKN
ncbi:MAG: sigma-70 family RNA polymerase sigma factor [Bacilli bacterium]|nr:sigma-70 family RNA polymerase sigma factor [Bacilli bacterium]